MYQVPHFINGCSFSENTVTFASIHNPATGDLMGQVHLATPHVCDQAISAAQNAFPSWSQTPPGKRAQIFFNFRQLLEEKQHDIAAIITREHGKTLQDAMGSIARGIEIVEQYCGLLLQYQGAFSSEVARGVDCYTLRQPLGVCAGVSPFNFPVMVPLWMMIPAIACGNTFILKPSEQTPSASHYLMKLLHEAGLPAGVVNAVQGDKSTVDYLLSHPSILAMTAVASTPVAKHIFTMACGQGKRAHTFGGAKNHAVIMPDADFKQTANALVGAAYGSSGERCMAISVAITVGEETAKRLLHEMISRVNAIKIDAGDAADVDMGPLISKEHRERVLHAINQGIAEGAKLIIDGRHFKHPKYPHGFYIGPSLFDHVTEQMSVYQQEIFGPVLVRAFSNTQSTLVKSSTISA